MNKDQVKGSVKDVVGKVQEKTGQVIGSTDKFAEHADERPVHYRDVFATLYHNLGIDVSQPVVEDAEGRPHYLLEGHAPVEELI